jgi:osmotically-inducible protein OsmY
MRSKAQISLVVAATLAAVACSDQERDFAGLDRGDRDVMSDSADSRMAREPMPAEADNTGRNVRDRDTNAVTPLDQSNSPDDIALTQKIRSGITADGAMSVQARNVKVISRDGFVTLRGPVETQQEKASIEALAKTAGATRVDNQLEIDRDAEAPVEEY